MEKIKILSLDISTKTGWSLAEIIDNKTYNLIDAGTLDKRDQPHDDYPKNYLDWACNCAIDIEKLIEQYTPDRLIIEETSKGSKNNFSQKILEFIHCFVAMYISKFKIKTTYYRTEEWRRMVGCLMSKEEKKQNANIRKEKRSKGTVVVKNDEGKRIGIVGKKHVNVRKANELFNLDLKLKDEDRADAILLGYAYFLNTKIEE
jgi:Holliday junction resolvasome RuvABC endonuclease subunit